MDKEFFDKYFDDNQDNFDEDSEEYDEEQEHNNKTGGKTFTKGFLTALAICIVAIGAAVWTTVNNVNAYLNPEVTTNAATETDLDTDPDSVYEPDTASSVSAQTTSDAQVNATVSGVKDQNDDTDKEVVFTVLPVNGEIICDYSENPVYNETLKDYRAHPAIDYAAAVDDKVRCMASGVVTDIYNDEMLGNVVEIQHSESIISLYCGLAGTALVQIGDEVTAGDFVGTVYAIPCETADKAHVHVAAKKDGEWINPEDLMVTQEN